jgi:hypothetical protein
LQAWAAPVDVLEQATCLSNAFSVATTALTATQAPTRTG